MSTTIEIVGGDDKFDLLAQLADIGRYDDRKRDRFDLILQDPKEAVMTLRVSALIDGVKSSPSWGKEGDTWEITGVFFYMSELSLDHWFMELILTKYGARFKATYNTRLRKGKVVFG